MRSFLITAALIALAAPLSACAGGPSGYSNAAPYGGGGYQEASFTRQPAVDGLLPEPPANARAGECYAKVVVPGQPVMGPPTGPHLKWVQSPPPPGAVGPVWCQVWEQGYQPAITYTPEQYGWIRVICDKDATREKIGHIQRRLHDYGYYQGGYDGQYDAATATAVTRFQEARHIQHGGYLSYQTMTALDAAPPPPAPSPLQYAPQYVPQYVSAPPVYAPPVYAPPAPTYGYAPSPCRTGCQAPVVQPPCPGPCGYGQGGYGQQGYGYNQRQWLTWPGKSGF